MATKADAFVSAAMQEIGKPYRFGDEGPATFDCSGLVLWAAEKAGFTVPRTSQDQQELAQPITASAARPGDLVFWGAPAHHVGIYLGGGRVLHAPKAGDVVRVADVWGSPTYGRLPGIGGVVADVIDVGLTKPVSFAVDGIKQVVGDVGVVLVVSLGGAALIGLGAWQAVKGGSNE